MQIVERASPNFGARRGGAPDMVLVHYTGMATAAAAVARLCDPGAEVSAHYVIGPEGTVWRLVDETARAWHAGVAVWAGRDDVNSQSIGIELANPGPLAGMPPYPAAQMAALTALLAGIRARWGIPPWRVLGHACVAPGRKIDPGPKFDWRGLALAGHGVWLDPVPAPAGPGDAAAFQAAARRFGYGVPEGGAWCDATRAVWRAFAERFLAGRAGPDAAGVAHLARLADRWPAA